MEVTELTALVAGGDEDEILSEIQRLDVLGLMDEWDVIPGRGNAPEDQHDLVTWTETHTFRWDGEAFAAYERDTYEIRDDSGGSKTIHAVDIDDAVDQLRAWLADQEAPKTETEWAHGWVSDDTGEDVADATVAIHPPEPECDGGWPHRWETPVGIVGGCESSPGVYGHGGGVTCAEVCPRCGCGKHTDSWAQDPATGRQGLTSIRYEPSEYLDRLWSLPDKQLCVDDDEAIKKWSDKLRECLIDDDAYGVVGTLRDIAREEERMGRELVDWADLPAFGEVPEDREGVLTWSPTHLFVGTSADDVEAVDRED